jgi:two-component system, OmpR family, sensor histidine kinase SenX3
MSRRIVVRRRLQEGRRELAAALSAAAAGAGRSSPSIRDAIGVLIEQRDHAVQQSAFIRSAVERSTDGVLVLGSGLEVRFATAAARRLLNGGHGGAEAAARLRSLAREVAATGEGAAARLEVRVPDGRVYRAHAEVLPSGFGPGVAIQISDVTDQERVEAIRRDFVANVSHELKTPVGALVVLAEAVEHAADDAVRERLLARLQHEAKRVAALVDDILDLSLVESEEPGLGPVDVCDVVREAARRVAVVAEDAGVGIVVDVPDLPLMVCGDRRQLVSAVANLLDNAVKYSAFRREPESRVWARALRRGGELVIEVEDKGIGIAESHRGRIFERFYRVDRGRSRSQGGTGLGLAIVRHVAINHRGRVEVDSTPGVGSTFRLLLPVED